MAKVQFGSKIGLIAATVGSAVGLGNIWRFPAEAQANGGGAFLIVYLACVLLIGIPVMLGEFAIGREGATDAVGDYQKLSPSKKWWLIGGIGILASYLINMFYIVVAGWTLEYLFGSVTGDLFAGISETQSSGVHFANKMQEYIQYDFGPLIFSYIVIVLNIVILLKGVKKGIERMSNLMMPVLFILLLIFCYVSITLPGASKGIEFFLTPDFSKITPSVIINALGQAFFSLSLGMGVLITYAAYYPKKTKLIGTATTVSLLDMLVSVLMGLIIFPSIASFDMMDNSYKGLTLVFVTLPEIFQQMPATQFWSVLFFLLLFVAALTSTISIGEVTVRFCQDRMKLSRVKSVLLVFIPLFIFSSLCSLSQGSLSDVKIFGLTIFDFLDTFATNILLPIGSLLMCIYLGWFAPKGLLVKQLTNNNSVAVRLSKVIIFIIRWIAPIAIAMILLSQFVKF